MINATTIINGNWYADYDTYKLVERGQCEWHSTSQRAYEEGELSAACAMHRSMGYLLMAEEREPYNPIVLFWLCGAISVFNKSIDYQIEKYTDIVTKLNRSIEYGYKEKEFIDDEISRLNWVINQLNSKKANGKFFEVIK